MLNWQLEEAKNRFSEVVRLALTSGPQRVTRGDDVVVVMSEAEYGCLIGNRPGIVDQFISGPSLEGLDLSRDKLVPVKTAREMLGFLKGINTDFEREADRKF